MEQDIKIKKLSQAILKDSISLRKLTDRVYELMLEDLQNQNDRLGGTLRRN